jgi:hypothetical protein
MRMRAHCGNCGSPSKRVDDRLFGSFLYIARPRSFLPDRLPLVPSIPMFHRPKLSKTTHHTTLMVLALAICESGSSDIRYLDIYEFCHSFITPVCDLVLLFAQIQD